MNSVLLKYVYYGITAVSFIVMGLSVKYLLGGYDKLAIEKGSGVNYIIAGRYIDPEWNDEKISAFDEELRSKLEEKKTEARISTVWFFSDSLAEASATYFKGIAYEGTIVTIPSGYEVLDIYEDDSYRVMMKMHPLVRPSTQHIRNLFLEESEQELTKLDDKLIWLEGQSDTIWVVNAMR